MRRQKEHVDVAHVVVPGKDEVAEVTQKQQPCHAPRAPGDENKPHHSKQDPWQPELLMKIEPVHGRPVPETRR